MDEKIIAREESRATQIGKRRVTHQISFAGESVGKWIATSPP
jgi:hypothetical protein